MATGAPSVSVIVRSMARPTLGRALASVRAQQYPALETLVIDASGAGQPDTSGYADIGLRVIGVGAPLSRAAAANLGMATAINDAMIFLDDDDEFEPAHLADLARLLAASRDSGAVYSGARVELMSGEKVAEFNFPFNRLNLMTDNYLVIHSVLFRRQLVDAGIRFDENLDVYEDWDFWVQLALRTSFIHTGRVTATYIADRGLSGVGMGRNRDATIQAVQRQRIHDKWQTPFRALLKAFEAARDGAMAAQRAGMTNEFQSCQREAIEIVRGATGCAIAAGIMSSASAWPGSD